MRNYCADFDSSVEKLTTRWPDFIDLGAADDVTDKIKGQKNVHLSHVLLNDSIKIRSGHRS